MIIFFPVVHIADLAHARAQELHSLLQELGQRQDKHRTALQILPRYMRRRAASYNIKRLPRSLRPLADPKTVNMFKKKKHFCHKFYPNHFSRVQLKQNDHLVVIVVDLEIYLHLIQIVKEKLNGLKLISGMRNVFI
jgi:hypothetical protein